MSTLTTQLREAGIPVRKISNAEYNRLKLQFPAKSVRTLRIPSKRKHIRDAIVPIRAEYGGGSNARRVCDANGEPWSVKPDVSGLATYVAVR